jgi:hypothetical protein
MKERELIIDGTGLLFIKTSTDLKLRIDDILKNSGISKYRMFLKENMNNQTPINKRFDVEKELIKTYNAELHKNMKDEIVKLYNSDKDRYMVATLSGELFDMLDGIHFDYYFKRNYLKTL